MNKLLFLLLALVPLLVLAPSLSYAVTPEQHKTFVKCLKVVEPDIYANTNLSADLRNLTAHMEQEAVTATGMKNSTLMQLLTDCMQGKKYTSLTFALNYHTPTPEEMKELNATTNGVHDWLQREDGKLCMNPASQATKNLQHDWQSQVDYVRTHGGQLNYQFNPWPLLCSTDESQANDYFARLNNGEIP